MRATNCSHVLSRMENFVGGLHDTFDLGIAHQHFELLVSVGYPYSTRMWTLVKLTV